MLAMVLRKCNPTKTSNRQHIDHVRSKSLRFRRIQNHHSYRQDMFSGLKDHDMKPQQMPNHATDFAIPLLTNANPIAGASIPG